MKNTLPVRPFLTSRVISARASSTSARTSVDICVVASLIRSPIDGSPDLACGSANGIVVKVLGTPFVGSALLTDGPLDLIPRFAVVAVHVAMWCSARRGQPQHTGVIDGSRSSTRTGGGSGSFRLAHLFFDVQPARQEFRCAD